VEKYLLNYPAVLFWSSYMLFAAGFICMPKTLVRKQKTLVCVLKWYQKQLKSNFRKNKEMIMKIITILIKTAGVICLLFMFFHLLFFKLFNWPESLKSLSNDNRSILLTYHYISILLTGFMAFVALFQTKAVLSSSLKYSVLGMFSLFYLIRIITEFTLFGIGGDSVIIIVMCAIPLLFFGIPLLVNTRTEE